MNSIIKLFLCALVASLAATASICSDVPASIKICCKPSQVLFVLDVSMSINQTTVDAGFEWVKKARCLYADNLVETGLITFGTQVAYNIQLSKFTTADWVAAVDGVHNSLDADAKRGKWTPLAEALVVAKAAFVSTTGEDQCTQLSRTVFVLTDGYPAQNKYLDDSPDALGLDYGPWGFAPTPSGPAPVSHGSYVEVVVPQQAAYLKGISPAPKLVMVALPGLNLNIRTGYFAGTINPDMRCNTFKVPSPTPTPSINICSTANRNIPNTPTASPQRARSQCYGSRDLATNGWDFSDNKITCFIRPSTTTGVNFPIASSSSDIIGLTAAPADIVNVLLDTTSTKSCPA